MYYKNLKILIQGWFSKVFSYIKKNFNLGYNALVVLRNIFFLIQQDFNFLTWFIFIKKFINGIFISNLKNKIKYLIVLFLI